MKATLQRLIAAVMLVTLGVSCTTAYDAYGRPVSVVDPGMAALGIAAAGVAGYALTNNNRNRNWNRNHQRGFYDNRRSLGHHHRRQCNPPARPIRYW